MHLANPRKYYDPPKMYFFNADLKRSVNNFKLADIPTTEQLCVPLILDDYPMSSGSLGYTYNRIKLIFVKRITKGKVKYDDNRPITNRGKRDKRFTNYLHRIRAIKHKKGWTNKELADNLGVSLSLVQAWQVRDRRSNRFRTVQPTHARKINKLYKAKREGQIYESTTNRFYGNEFVFEHKGRYPE